MQEYLVFYGGATRTTEVVCTDSNLDFILGADALLWNPEPDQRQPENWLFENGDLVWSPLPQPIPQPGPDLPAFYRDLAVAILSGQLPEDVRGKALLINDLQDPVMQSAAFKQMASSPTYTAEHLALISSLIVKHRLALSL